MTSRIPEMNAFRMEHADMPHPTIEQLRHVVRNFPVIDHHAHSLLLPAHLDSVPFESITTEARGRALRDTFKSLPHLRASRQLRELYECPDDSDWGDVLEQRLEWLKSDPDRLNARCLEGVHAVLVDDGMPSPEKFYPSHFLDRYTKAPCRRIVRIEAVAERLMQSILRDASERDLKHASYLTDTWVSFTEDFERGIQDALRDPSVAGFKSIICHRSGLDIEPDYEVAAKDVAHTFERYVDRCVRKGKFRIEKKALNDYLVLRTLEIVSEHLLQQPDAVATPFLLHTGLGDNDISLLEANPAYLQPLIENYPSVPFVLLHSAYPYTREAGYLATVYKHVYLDMGEVFPMVSRDGQNNVLRQALEIVPGNKLLYSSNGHSVPESFWLAQTQFKEVWLELLIEYVKKGDLTAHQAISMTKDMLFHNANALYDLQYQPDFKEIPDSQQALPHHEPPSPSTPSPSATPVPEPLSKSQGPGALTPRLQLSATDPSTSRSGPMEFPPPPKEPQVYDVTLFETFMAANGDLKFVHVQWLDYMAIVRGRILPVQVFERLIHSGERIGIFQEDTGSVGNADSTIHTVGQIYVEPDLTSLRRARDHGPLVAASVLSYWRYENGQPLPECPRANLEGFVKELEYTYGATLLVAFGIEVTFLEQSNRNRDLEKEDKDHNRNEDPRTSFEAVTPPRAPKVFSAVAEIADSLLAIGIELQEFHAEGDPGQYRFALPPLMPLVAVDALVQARQVVFQVALSHDLKATLHAHPLPGMSNAASATISLQSPDPAYESRFFLDGILAHLPSICAFTMPSLESYAHDPAHDAAASSSWVAWGTQNRYTPLSRMPTKSLPGADAQTSSTSTAKWHFRPMDGFASPYFALSALLAAGIIGLQTKASSAAPATVGTTSAPTSSADQASLPVSAAPNSHPTTHTTPMIQHEDIHFTNPAHLAAEDRTRLGITTRMPASLKQAVDALQADTPMLDKLRKGFLGDYLFAAAEEARVLRGLGERGRWEGLVARY